jgi:hypothetical protein
MSYHSLRRPNSVQAKAYCSLLLVVLMLASCAAVYTDSAGVKHVLGLVALEIRPPPDPQTIAGDIVDITIAGVGFYATSEQGSFVLGYEHDVTAALRDSSLVIGNPIQAIAPLSDPAPLRPIEEAR